VGVTSLIDHSKESRDVKAVEGDLMYGTRRSRRSKGLHVLSSGRDDPSIFDPFELPAEAPSTAFASFDSFD
jgi:hypothetical protein